MAMAKVQNAAVNHYNLINKGWGEVKLAPPTDREASESIKTFWRSEGLKWHNWPIEIVSGNRYTWLRHGIYSVNPNRRSCLAGWASIVHDVSHQIHNKKNRGPNGDLPRPHNFGQAKIERRLQQLVINKLAK